MRDLTRGLLYGVPLLWVACAGPEKQERPSVEETRAIYESKGRGEQVPTTEPQPQAKTWQDSLDENGPPSAPDRQVVATVAGQEIMVQDLLSTWMFRDSSQVRGLLDRLVLDALVRAEASRLGLRLAEDMVTLELTTLLREFEKEAKKSAPDLTTDQFIERRLGLDAKRYRSRMEARRVLDLLAQRCVRAFTLESESVQARMLVVGSRADADKLEAGLAMGRSFGELAKAFSLDPSGEDGGRIPPIVRSQAAISRLAFATAIGEVGGPLVENGKHIYLAVEAVNGGQAGPWSELGPTVEASLEIKPIEDLEFLQWQAMVSARYEVDTSPLLRWVGEPESGIE